MERYGLMTAASTSAPTGLCLCGTRPRRPRGGAQRRRGVAQALPESRALAPLAGASLLPQRRQRAAGVAVRANPSPFGSDKDDGGAKGAQQQRSRGGDDRRAPVSREAMLRSEVEAPFRVFRIASYLALSASAGLGGLIAFVRCVGGLARGEIDLTFAGFLASPDISGLAVDLVALAVLVSLYKRETSARDKQIARLQRETALSQLKAEINLKKPRLVTLQQLQGFARTVVVGGSEEYVMEALRSAAEVKAEIKDRSICIIPVVLGGAAQPANLSELTGLSDPEVLLAPILVDQWKAWLNQTMDEAGVPGDSNVYVGLRMDGRVRASGKGLPPWKKFIAELTPKQGIWSNDFMKGFDGRV